MMDSPLWLVWVGMLVGGAVAGFFAQRSRFKAGSFPLPYRALSDTDLLALYRMLLSENATTERRLLTLVQEEIIRRGLSLPR